MGRKEITHGLVLTKVPDKHWDRTNELMMKLRSLSEHEHVRQLALQSIAR